MNIAHHCSGQHHAAVHLFFDIPLALIPLAPMLAPTPISSPSLYLPLLCTLPFYVPCPSLYPPLPCTHPFLVPSPSLYPPLPCTLHFTRLWSRLPPSLSLPSLACPLMFSHIRPPAVAPSAFTAEEFLCACVTSLMNFKIIGSVKRLATETALEGPNLAMGN